jgi:hypothetical protein
MKRSVLNFSKAELTRETVRVNGGIQLGKPALHKEAKKALQSFGLFGSNADTNKFYEGIRSASDIVPKEEDFVDVPFRLLSATVVGAGSWKATDFSDEKMLKKSHTKLLKKTVYVDHETDTHNWVGITKAVSWQKSETKNGLFIPAGINGILALDAKTAPKLVRGVLLGAVYSNSVTVDFAWEKSHPEMSDEEFYDRMGLEVEGRMVTRKAVEIYDYFETSLVWLGADPFAKRIDEAGDLVNIDQTAIAAEKAAYKKEKVFTISFAVDKNTLALSRSELAKPERKTENPMEKAIIDFLKTKLGLDETDELNLEAVQTLDVSDQETVIKAATFDKLVAKHASLKDADPEKIIVLPTEDFTALEKGKVTLQALEAEKPFIQLGKNFLKAKKDEAIRLYRVATGENASEAVVDLFEKADADAIEGLLKQYVKGATEKFSGKCKSCGSQDFEFRSSFETSDPEPEQLETFNTLYQRYSQSQMIK